MSEIPVLTTDQMREVDRAMVEDYHIDLVQMMENAGRHLAGLARERLMQGNPQGRSVLVFCGTGGNGGGGLVAARRLHGWGAQVLVRLARPVGDYGGVPGHQLDIARRVGVGIEMPPYPESVAARQQPDVLIDALVGYGLQGALKGEAARLVDQINGLGASVLSLDAPSGLDSTSGRPYGACVRADATLTLAYPKTGLFARGAEESTGELYLADIGVPHALIAAEPLDLQPEVVFARREVLRLDRGPGLSEPATAAAVEALLTATSNVHHKTFARTDGVDPKWAAWYAHYAGAALEGLLGVTVAEERFARLLTEFAEASNSDDEGSDWASSYTQLLMQRLRV